MKALLKGDTKMKKINVLLVITIGIFLTMMISTNASSITSNIELRNWTSGTMKHGGYLLMGEQKVFCVQPGVIFKPNKTYVSCLRPYYINDEQQKLFELISYYGTEYYSSERYWAATQSLIWANQNENINDATFKVNGISVLPEMNNILDKVNQHYIKPSFEKNSHTLTLNETYYLKDENNVLDNYEIVETDGIQITKESNQLSIKVIDPNIKNKTIYLENKANKNNGTTTWYKLKGSSDSKYYSGWQRCAKFYVSESIISEFEITLKHEGKLIINKSSSKDEYTKNNTNYSVDQAIYGLYTDELCTNLLKEIDLTDGSSNPINLNIGKYYVKEIKQPSAFLLNDTIYMIDILNNETTVLNAFDDPILIETDVIIKKTDEKTNKPLENVLFDIKYYDNLENEPIKEWTFKTDVNGEIKIDKFHFVDGDELFSDSTFIPFGYLKIQEKIALDGYIRDDKTHLVDLKDSNLPLILKNKKNHFILKKIDSIDKTPIENIGFIHSNSNQDEQTYYTNNNGIIELYGLNKGKHIFKELNHPNYSTNNEIYEIYVDDNGNVSSNLTIENTLIKGQIKINKYGKELKNNILYQSIPLKEVEFTLFALKDIFNEKGKLVHAKDEIIEVLKTNEFGIAISSNLPLGEYYLKESKTIDGYIIDPKTYELALTKENSFIELNLENNRDVKSIEVLKKDINTNKLLKNAIIGIYLKDDIYDENGHIYITKDTLMDINTTNESGQCTLKISFPMNNYYIKEIEAPDGYILDENLYEVKDKVVVFNEAIQQSQTGDQPYFFYYFIIFLLSLNGIYMLNKKKRGI